MTLTKEKSDEPFKEMAIKEVGEKESGFEGTLKNFRLTDLIQMCCMSGVTTTVQVTQGGQQGTIFIDKGDIVHAICKETAGEEALYQILSWRQGRFETMMAESPSERTIDKNWEFLLMEGARIDDEETLVNAGPPATDGEAFSSDHPERLRVLIVDDSPLMCGILKDLLSADEEIDVIGMAHNGEEALRKIETLKPGLIMLDVNMPVMHGGTALMHIMIKNPCPIVIISKLGSRFPLDIINFLRLGAVDFIPKPKKADEMPRQQRQLIERIKKASKVKIENFRRVIPPKAYSDTKEIFRTESPCPNLVVVSSSSGGYAELIRLLSLLPGSLEACLIALQNMPLEFVPFFSDYLNTISGLGILPTPHHVPLFSGRCYLSTHDFYLKIISEEGRYSLVSEEGASESPPGLSSLDSLLCSAAENFTGGILVILLSGAEIGNLNGLRKIKEREGRIIAQHLNSSLAPQPLQKVKEAQLVDFEGSCEEIAKQIMEILMKCPA